VWAYEKLAKETRAMALWVDKYRPSTLDQLTYHAQVTSHLRKMVCLFCVCALSLSGENIKIEKASFPHLLFYGPSGSGKHTRVHALLREFYGPSAEKVSAPHR
jgi:replication factor C subunit 3/5